MGREGASSVGGGGSRAMPSHLKEKKRVPRLLGRQDLPLSQMNGLTQWHSAMGKSYQMKT